jgi:hypothetical protein
MRYLFLAVLAVLVAGCDAETVATTATVVVKGHVRAAATTIPNTTDPTTYSSLLRVVIPQLERDIHNGNYVVLHKDAAGALTFLTLPAPSCYATFDATFKSIVINLEAATTPQDLQSGDAALQALRPPTC